MLSVLLDVYFPFAPLLHGYKVSGGKRKQGSRGHENDGTQRLDVLRSVGYFLELFSGTYVASACHYAFGAGL